LHFKLEPAYLFKAYFSNNKIPVFFFIIFSVYGLSISLKNRIAIVSVIFFAILLCFYVGLNLPNYLWYYAPFLYMTLIFACRGIGGLSTRLLAKGMFNYRVFVFFALCIVTIFATTKVVSFKEGGRQETYARIGSWIEKKTASNASIAMAEIGTVGWYADRRIIDILGLVNKYNADYIGKGDLYGWLTRYQPDYILRHDPVWRFEKATEILEQNAVYVPVQEFNFPGYALLRKTDKYSDDEIANYFQKMSEQIAKIRALK
jgi:arabinofuranosyltransferase